MNMSLPVGVVSEERFPVPEGRLVRAASAAVIRTSTSTPIVFSELEPVGVVLDRIAQPPAASRTPQASR